MAQAIDFYFGTLFPFHAIDRWFGVVGGQQSGDAAEFAFETCSRLDAVMSCAVTYATRRTRYPAIPPGVSSASALPPDTTSGKAWPRQGAPEAPRTLSRFGNASDGSHSGLILKFAPAGSQSFQLSILAIVKAFVHHHDRPLSWVPVRGPATSWHPHASRSLGPSSWSCRSRRHG